jgi:acetaldehyde dehydrogenase/alcohol dehydrogenase
MVEAPNLPAGAGENPATDAPIIDVPGLEAALKRARAAQREFATFSQAQVDKIFHAAAIAANTPANKFAGRKAATSRRTL